MVSRFRGPAPTRSAHAYAFARDAQVVHQRHIAWTRCRRERPIGTQIEDGGVDGTVHEHRAPHAGGVQRHDLPRLHPAVVCRRCLVTQIQPCTSLGPSAAAACRTLPGQHVASTPLHRTIVQMQNRVSGKPTILGCHSALQHAVSIRRTPPAVVYSLEEMTLAIGLRAPVLICLVHAPSVRLPGDYKMMASCTSLITNTYRSGVGHHHSAEIDTPSFLSRPGCPLCLSPLLRWCVT